MKLRYNLIFSKTNLIVLAVYLLEVQQSALKRFSSGLSKTCAAKYDSSKYLSSCAKSLQWSKAVSRSWGEAKAPVWTRKVEFPKSMLHGLHFWHKLIQTLFLPFWVHLICWWLVAPFPFLDVLVLWFARILPYIFYEHSRNGQHASTRYCRGLSWRSQCDRKSAIYSFLCLIPDIVWDVFLARDSKYLVSFLKSCHI